MKNLFLVTLALLMCCTAFAQVNQTPIPTQPQNQIQAQTPTETTCPPRLDTELTGMAPLALQQLFCSYNATAKNQQALAEGTTPNFDKAEATQSANQCRVEAQRILRILKLDTVDCSAVGNPVGK